MSDDNKRYWCVVCGMPKGDCTHIAGYTSNTNEAYRAFLKTLREKRDKSGNMG